MRKTKSKLELYEDVLGAIAEKPLTIDSIAYVCGMDCVILQGRLEFLIKNSLVEERESSETKRTFYAITPRGLSIYKALAISRRLEKLQGNITATKTLQTIPVFSEEKKKKPQH